MSASHSEKLSRPASPASTQTIQLTLMGQKIVLKTSADPAKVAEVTKLVEERLKSSEARLKGSTAPHLAAVLALFDLAEEYLEAKERTTDHLGKIRDWVQVELGV